MNKVLIIAEAGVNHNGDINLAYKLVDEAKNAGADIIKFQTFNIDSLLTKNVKTAEYQSINVENISTQHELLKKLSLTYKDFININEYCKKKNIIFLSTPFDIDSIEFLNNFDLPFWKIPSGEITNYPYLIKIGNTNKDVVLSTGMSSLDEIRDAVNVLKNYGAKNISLLHCNTEYPTPFQDVNLNAMITLKNEFKCQVGYSDHTKGIEVPIAAVALGATIIEKHFTLDNNMIGPDHKASLEPNEFKRMVTSIRNIEIAIGDGCKIPTLSEKKNIEVVRKSIVAKCSIKKGELLTVNNITTKRPGGGISPMKWNEIIGKTAIRDFDEDELIEI